MSRSLHYFEIALLSSIVGNTTDSQLLKTASYILSAYWLTLSIITERLENKK